MFDARRGQSVLDELLGAGIAVACGQAPPRRAPLDPGAVADALADAEVVHLGALAAIGAKALGQPDEVTQAEVRSLDGRARAAWFHAAAREVSGRLDRAGLRHVFFKGVVSDALFFGGRGLRGTSDVDVLVDDLDAAAAALGDLTTGEAVEAGRPRLGLLRTARTLPATVFGQRVFIDLQGSWFRAPLVDDTAGVLARAVRQGRELPRPALEDAMAYAGGNLVMDRFSGRLKLAVDVAMALGLGLPCDWGVVVQRARAWRCGGALWALLDWTTRHLGAAVPLDVLGGLRPPAPRRALLEASAAGAPLPGIVTRSFESDSLAAGLRHFVRYLPARLVDKLVDERR